MFNELCTNQISRIKEVVNREKIKKTQKQFRNIASKNQNMLFENSSTVFSANFIVRNPNSTARIML